MNSLSLLGSGDPLNLRPGSPNLPMQGSAQSSRRERRMTIPQQAVVFDMDGVVTDTASVHSSAWKQLFDEILADPRLQPAEGCEPGDVNRGEFLISTDYRTFVDGRAREDGVRTLLASRNAALPEGTEGDQPGDWTVQGQAALKNDYFQKELDEHGVEVFQSTVDLARRLKDAGIPTALVTASRNSRSVLEAAELGDLFEVIVDGAYALEHGIPGKPAPDMFLAGAEQLGVDPAQSVVIEDAVSGVQAAKAGGFGLVVGINRHGERRDLEEAGADLVINDAAELDLGADRSDPWKLVFRGYDPHQEGHREVLLALANGYMGVRGARPEAQADEEHYPGTYVSGLFNRVVSHINGRDLEHESMVNVPNFLPFDLRLRGGEWWSEGGLRELDEVVELDLRTGLLSRTCILEEFLAESRDEGTEDTDRPRRVRLQQRRLVSMAHPHLAACETTLTPLGWSGRIHVRNGIDPTVVNDNVAEYKALAKHHLVTDASTTLPDHTLISVVHTNQSSHQVAEAQRTQVTPDTSTRVEREIRPGGVEMRRYRVEGTDGEPVVFDTATAVVTSRDAAIASAPVGAVEVLNRNATDFESLYTAHARRWERLWHLFSLRIDAPVETTLPLHLHLFHIIQTLAPNMAGLDAGVTARGLNGEGYRGHIFWDEIFILPIVNVRLPEVTKSLLEYRAARLRGARHRAQEFGARGAMFPWQSGSDGREETPVELYNPHSDRWMPDNSWRQFHVGLAIAYNAWQYYVATGDVEWLGHQGADLMLEITRFFDSLVTFDPEDGKYHIEGAMGPDEYHDGYPGSEHGGGVKDNAYTNVLAAWLFRHAQFLFEELPEHLVERVLHAQDITEEERERWREIAGNLAVPFNFDGVISQFDGYDALKDIDWDYYRRKYGNIGRMDLILEAEGDATNNYKLSKQADTLMLVYLFGAHGLQKELAHLGYEISLEKIEETVRYYLPRTSNGSTLSRVVTANILARIDQEHSWAVYQEALLADLDDTQGGTTQEGIHLGAMCGTVDVVQRAYAGLQVHAKSLWLDPSLPQDLHSVSFRICYRGQMVTVDLNHQTLCVTAESSRAADVPLSIFGHQSTVPAGQTREYDIEQLRASSQV